MNYRNPVSLSGQRYHFAGNGKGLGGPNRKPSDELTTSSRKDDTWSTELEITWFLSPEFQADLSCLYRDVGSAADFESFQELGGFAKNRLVSNGFFGTPHVGILVENRLREHTATLGAQG
jgi:hypothetical protein